MRLTAASRGTYSVQSDIHTCLYVNSQFRAWRSSQHLGRVRTRILCARHCDSAVSLPGIALNGLAGMAGAPGGHVRAVWVAVRAPFPS
jgi:hypothetical protein